MKKSMELIYARAFQGAPEVFSWAPGRVNLIGEHTDYNDGFVLPMAVDKGVALLGAARQDRNVRLHSADYNHVVEFSLDHLATDPQNPWVNYFKGVADQFQKKGLKLKGCQAVLKGDLPQGAGLSSSAALEIASAVFLQKTSGFELPDLDLVKAAQSAENQFVEVNCGIMDQYASYLSKAGHALLIDCKSLKCGWVPMKGPVKVVVCDTRVKRTLANSAYNDRRKECERGLRALNARLPAVQSLRHLTLEDLKKHQGLLDPVALKRVRHVVTENQRVLDAVAALEKGDYQAMGRLMVESHESLKNDYEVSCRELDVMVRIARNNPQVYGGRMTGAGFGGCTVNLVREEAVAGFRREILDGYKRETGRDAEVYVFTPADGAKNAVEERKEV